MKCSCLAEEPIQDEADTQLHMQAWGLSELLGFSNVQSATIQRRKKDLRGRKISQHSLFW